MWTEMALAVIMTLAATAAAADKSKVFYCNATGPCLPCGPQARNDPDCLKSGYKQELECVQWDSGNSSPPPHDVAITHFQGTAGAKVPLYSGCGPGLRLSVVQFEALMVLGLLAAAVVIRIRQRR